MSSDQVVTLGTQIRLPVEWTSHATAIVVGKDILELLSSAMYVDPRSIFREYIQNAADSIDEARQVGLLSEGEPGCVAIDMDAGARTIKIRDNGVGLAQDEFEPRLTAFGASKKRGTDARGFRGVGRLAGLGYCQELVFRSRIAGASYVNEMKWDCRRLRSLLRDTDFVGHLSALVDQTSATRRIDGRKWPDHFFEVELIGIVRHRNDHLLNPVALKEYLSEIGPVPFAPEFRYGAEISTALSKHLRPGVLDIRLNNAIEPIYRPHRDILSLGNEKFDPFTELEMVQVPSVDGQLAAIGWILHHGYVGALPINTRIKGLRLRCGNVQIGGDDLLQEVFPEPRFNSWAVGELHLLDRRLIPNGRRDHLEQNTHLFNLVNHMSPVAREISRRCRKSSLKRKRLRDFGRHQNFVKDKAAILRQRSLNQNDRARTIRQVEETLILMDRISTLNDLDVETRDSLSVTIRDLRRSLGRLLKSAPPKSVLAHLSPKKRRAYQDVFALIYECSDNQSTAKVLVDKILRKLNEKDDRRN